MAWPANGNVNGSFGSNFNVNSNVNGNDNGNGNSNANGNVNGNINGNVNSSFNGSQHSSISLPNGLNAATDLTRTLSGASQLSTPSASAPPADAVSRSPSLSQSLSQQSVDSTGSARPVFKNPLGLFRSPSPPSKRQKVTPGRATTSFSSALSASTSGGFRGSSNDSLGRLPSSLPSPSQTWAPRTLNLSQPVPGSSTPTRAPTRTATPVRTPVSSRPGSFASASSTQRGVSNPVKIRETTENNKTVLVIDDSDDEDDSSTANGNSNATVNGNNGKSVPASTTPVPVPAVPSFARAESAIASLKRIGKQPETPVPVPMPASRASHPVSNWTQSPIPSVGATQPLPPSNGSYNGGFSHNHAPNNSVVKPPPFDDSASRRNMHAIPHAQPTVLSASQPPPTRPPVIQAFASPSTPIPATPARPAYIPIPADIVQPIIHHNESPSTKKAIAEHLEPAINVDITPTKLSTLPLVPQAKAQSVEQHFIRYANLARRPYLRSSHRRYVAQNYHKLPTLLGMPRQRRALAADPPSPSMVIHVDFLPDEMNHLLDVVRFVHANAGVGRPSKRAAAGQKHSSTERELKSLLRRQPPEFEHIVVNSTSQARLPGRKPQDIYDFLIDARSGHINNNDGSSSSHNNSNKLRGGFSGTEALAPTLGGPAALTLKRHDRTAYSSQETQATRATKLNTLLIMREVAGQRPMPGRSRQLLNFTNAVRTFREDGLRLRNQWTSLAGDVITISWTSKDAFICGTTTHMDERNHQYNRQGNLALGSVTAGTLRAYPDHRIARVKVTTNPTDPTQPPRRPDVHDDPWLYTSVVSSDYNAAYGLAFTAGFDKNAILWKVSEDGSSMSPQATWRHDGKVNFVVTSTNTPQCLVATAADVPINAVTVYRLPTLEERMRGNRQPTFKKFSCSHVSSDPADKWAYFPAAIRWGLSETTRHLLLVGYSPRSLDINTDDEDIPEDRRNSGELCLWDGLDAGRTWRILGANSQNVFEVAWHPTQPCFIAATAPTMHQANEHNAHTQIRIFRLSANSEYGGRAYSEVQTLDCYADDINELALRPNSFRYLYVAAGCTNGHTYVWDTWQGDNPIHDLGHDACIEELSGDRISTEDTGVKFVAWGETPDRLYTGSSDGVVKVWNIRTHGVSGLSPFVRNLLQCPGPVSFGAFSPDKSKLAIGDASGRVFLMSVEDGMEDNDEDGDAFISEEEEAAEEAKKNQGVLQPRGRGQEARTSPRHNHLAFRHHPPELIQHPAPPPPSSSTPAAAPNSTDIDEDEFPALARSRAFLKSGQLVIAPDPTVGAVKGPNYAETNLFCLDVHQDRQPDRPLLAQFDRLQQENRPRASTSPSRQRPLRSIYPDVAPAPSFTSFGPSSRSLAVLGAPDPLQSLQRQNAFRRVQMQHATNLSYDLDVNTLPEETREALELADRAALLHIDDNDYDYGLDYEDTPDVV